MAVWAGGISQAVLQSLAVVWLVQDGSASAPHSPQGQVCSSTGGKAHSSTAESLSAPSVTLPTFFLANQQTRPVPGLGDCKTDGIPDGRSCRVTLQSPWVLGMIENYGYFAIHHLELSELNNEKEASRQIVKIEAALQNPGLSTR